MSQSFTVKKVLLRDSLDKAHIKHKRSKIKNFMTFERSFIIEL